MVVIFRLDSKWVGKTVQNRSYCAFKYFVCNPRIKETEAKLFFFPIFDFIETATWKIVSWRISQSLDWNIVIPLFQIRFSHFGTHCAKRRNETKFPLICQTNWPFGLRIFRPRCEPAWIGHKFPPCILWIHKGLFFVLHISEKCISRILMIWIHSRFFLYNIHLFKMKTLELFYKVVSGFGHKFLATNPTFYPLIQIYFNSISDCHSHD